MDDEEGRRAVDGRRECPPLFVRHSPPRSSSLPSASGILRRGSSRRMHSTARPTTEYAWALLSEVRRHLLLLMLLAEYL